jgi:Protein of unknown function (DUF4038)
MPFRAAVEDVETYASDRQAKGFNAVLLMTVQPDMNARAPVGRNVDKGFEIGFHDLAEGRLTKINVEYFQYFDKIIDRLIDHGITPWRTVNPRESTTGRTTAMTSTKRPTGWTSSPAKPDTRAIMYPIASRRCGRSVRRRRS